MFNKVVITKLAIVVGAYIMLCVPALFIDGYLEKPIGLIVVLPVSSIYFFNSIGIPGLLENSGACGAGWCSPTLFGWVFISCFWIVVVWLMLYAITPKNANKA